MPSTVNKRHAYAILAHADRKCLEVLLKLLDDSRNDIYLHLDKKSSPAIIEGLACEKSGLFFIPDDKRVDVRWGDLSFVEAELTLFQEILEAKKNYSYIHLLSGQDLPLRTQDEIHAFFNEVEEGANFVDIADGEAAGENLNVKIDYQYVFTRHQRLYGNKLVGIPRLFLIRVIRHLWLNIQKSVGYRRKWGNLKRARGINWVSITEDFARYLVLHKKIILKLFRHTITADEIYKQTMIVNSSFDSTVKCPSRGNCRGIRFIDWKQGNNKGNPKIWLEEDWDELNSAYELFARKFSSQIDYEIIKKIYNKLTPANHL